MKNNEGKNSFDIVNEKYSVEDKKKKKHVLSILTIILLFRDEII